MPDDRPQVIDPAYLYTFTDDSGVTFAVRLKRVAYVSYHGEAYAGRAFFRFHYASGHAVMHKIAEGDEEEYYNRYWHLAELGYIHHEEPEYDPADVIDFSDDDIGFG